MTDTNSAFAVETAAKQLDRILGFFPRVEAKASFVFALNTAQLGPLATSLSKEDLWIWPTFWRKGQETAHNDGG